MSGTIDSAGQVAAITNAGKYTPVENPLQVFSGWQDYANKVAQNAQIKASTANMTQEHATNARINGAKIAFGLSSLPDQALAGGAPVYKAIDAQVASGGMNAQEAASIKSQLPPPTQPDGTPTPGAAYRPYINAHLIGTLGGPEAIQAVTGHNVAVNNGAQMSGGMQAGPLSQTPGAITTSGPVYTQLPGPANIDLGNQIVPTTGGAQIGQPLQKGLAPTLLDTGGETRPVINGQVSGAPIAHTLPVPDANRIETWQDNNGNIITGPHSLRVPQQAMPQNLRTNLTSQGSGNYPVAGAGGSTVTIPAGQPANQQSDVTDFIADRKTSGDRIQNAQNLQKALTALQTVNTGSGNEWIAGNRAKVVTLLGDLGIYNSRMSSQDFSQAEADKLLTDYARKSGSAANSNGQLAASEASNPSTHINNMAAQDFVRNNIGLERQKAAAVYFQQQQNPRGIDYGTNLSKFSKDTDKRGFAYDTYTPAQLTTMISSMNPTQRNKFLRSMMMAKQMKLTGEQGSPVPMQNQMIQPAQSATPLGSQAPSTPLSSGSQ